VLIRAAGKRLSGTAHGLGRLHVPLKWKRRAHIMEMGQGTLYHAKREVAARRA
jgi:hypothetical protein